ncbi:MAG: cysteine synthase A [Pseudomonadota bacterium]
MARYGNILETIGNTPLVRLNRLAPASVNVYVKIESFNPLGSVKDRMASAIIADAEQRGALTPGQTVIEATSGNTGIGLAMVCAQKGYPLIVTMAESASLERRKILRYLGAKIVLTPAAEKGTGMLRKAMELAEAHNGFLCRQFDNAANADIHTRTTAPEILADMAGERLHAFVSGFGTGGTLLGTARALKAHDPSIRVVAAEPDNAQLLGSGIRQQRDADGNAAASHPNFRPHPMQGWVPDFISELTESAIDEQLVDEIVPVGGDDAMRLSRQLARQEGIFVGTSAGATLAAALDVAGRAEPGANIVCMLPDTAERYLSTPLFDDIGDNMTGEELALSRSTPGYRFDVPANAAPTPIRPAAALDREAEAFVTDIVDRRPVVMFALQWCEFCWSVRKLFQRLGIDYDSVDLDSVEFQRDERGGKIRAVLNARTGSPTIPQIFIGGEHVGGCTELFDEMRSGAMQARLRDAGADFDDGADFDPAELLPKWIHTRKSA